MVSEDTSYRNHAFHEALGAYIRAAIASLANLGAPRDVPLSAYVERGYKWVTAEHDGNGARSAYMIVPAPRYPNGFRESLSEMNEVQACAKALQDDPKIYEYFDQLVGVTSFSMRMDVRRCLGLFWDRYAAQCDGCGFDEPLFEEQYNLLERDLYRKTAKVRVVAPLVGCRLDNAVFLQDGLTIEPMQPDDGIHYIETSPETWGREIGSVEFPNMYAIVYEICLPKRVSSDNKKGDDGMEWMKTMDDVITGLCVFSGGSFVVEGFLITSESIFSAHTQRLGRRQRYGWGGQLHLKEVDTGARGFPELFLSLSSKTIKFHGAIGMALRRFRYASEREREEDRLVDLLIAAESLFLQDEGKELSYRLRQRVALLLGTTFKDRLEISDDIKMAYDSRSKVVHGSGKGHKAPLSVIVPKLEGYLRASLQKAISLAKSKDGKPAKAWMEWDAMIYDK